MSRALGKAVVLALALIASSAASQQPDPGPPPPAAPQPAPVPEPQPEPQPKPAPRSESVSGPDSVSDPVSGSVSDSASDSVPPPVSESASPSASPVAPPGTSLFETSAPAAPASQTDTDPPVDLGGYVRGDVFIGKLPGVNQGLVQAAYGELALQLDAREHEVGDAHAELRLRSGRQGAEQALFLDLREAYVNAYLGPVDVRVGQQIIVWGRADAFNPTNNLTPLDLRIRSPIEDDRRVGNVGVRAFYNLQPVRIEGVWLPLYLATHYPPIELDEFVVLSEPDYPEPALENGLGALRVHLELAAFEASVSYLHGYAPLPGLALRDFTVGVSPPEVRVARTAYAQNVVGFDASTALGDVVTLRAEVAYRHPVDYQDQAHAARPDLQYVLGADRAFGPVSVIVQYLGRYVRDWQREAGPEDPIEPETLVRFMPPLPSLLEASITESIEDELAVRNQALFSQTARVQHSVSARVEWITLHDTLSLSALGMCNLTTEEWLIFPKIGYRISDSMTTYVGAEVYVGPDGTLLDLIDQQLTAGYAELRYAF